MKVAFEKEKGARVWSFDLEQERKRSRGKMRKRACERAKEKRKKKIKERYGKSRGYGTTGQNGMYI